MVAVLVGAAGAVFVGQGTARAAGNAVSKLDEQCLGCHSADGIEKKLADGATLSLRVDGSAFAKSVHSKIGCAVCHGTVSLENHPPSKAKIAGIRDYSLQMTKVCSSCHGDIVKLYDSSTHAALVREGNAGAPVCTDCHNPHAVMAKAAYDAASGAPCSNCHTPIYEAYAKSVHGQSGLACSSCHHAHDVSPPTKGDQLKSACLECHQGVLDQHRTWLPNAEQHFETVTCAACHSPAAQRKVDLRLYNSAAGQPVAEREGVPQFESRLRAAGAKGTDLDAMALRSLLRGFNSEGTENETTLRGRLEVRTGVEAHQLTRSAQAIRDCAKCHQQGADAFRSVTVSIVGSDGRPVRYGAHPDVLNSVISVDSVNGFYAIGGTRIKLLDWLLVLAMLGGIGGPLAHMTVRWLFKRYAKKIIGDEDS